MLIWELGQGKVWITQNGTAYLQGNDTMFLPNSYQAAQGSKHRRRRLWNPSAFRRERRTLTGKEIRKMRATLKSICVLSVIACGIDPSSQAASPPQPMTQMAPNASFEQEIMQSMSKMDRDMVAAPVTGDPNHDFSAMMIPHHQGAIDMAKTFLLHGRDSALRQLAQEIIVTH